MYRLSNHLRSAITVERTYYAVLRVGCSAYTSIYTQRNGQRVYSKVPPHYVNVRAPFRVVLL